MKTPDNNPNKRNKKSKETPQTPSPLSNVKGELNVVDNLLSSTPKVVSPNIPQPEQALPILEINPEMFKEIIERATKINSNKVKRYIDDQKDAEALKSVIQEYYTSFILVGYTVDNKRLIIKSTSSDKDEDALIEELRYVFFRLTSDK